MQNVVEVACSSPPVAMNATKPAAQAVQATGQDPFDLVLKQASERIVNDRQSDSANRSSDSKSINKNHGSGIAANEKTSQNNNEREVDRTKKQEKTEQSEKPVVSEKSESDRRITDKKESTEAASEQSAMLFGVAAPAITAVENENSEIKSMINAETSMDQAIQAVESHLEMGLSNTTVNDKADVSETMTTMDQTAVFAATVNAKETLAAHVTTTEPKVEPQADKVVSQNSEIATQVANDQSEAEISLSDIQVKGTKAGEKANTDLKLGTEGSSESTETGGKASANLGPRNHGEEVNNIAQKHQEAALPDKTLADKTVKLAEVETIHQTAPPDNPNGTTVVTANATVQTTTQISEPARLAEAPKNEVITQVANQIDQLVKSNRSSIRLQLYPEELGHIDLRIVTTKGGVSVTMMTEKASTQQVLKSDMDMLKQNIEQAGIQLSNLNINQGQNSNRQQSFENRNNFVNDAHTGLNSGNSNQTNHEPKVHLTSSLVDYKV
jgi:flagellar hook-length control protein FliK